MRKRRGKNAAPAPAPAPASASASAPNGPRPTVFPARADGKKLYVNMPFVLFDDTPTHREQVFDWAGPDGAHHVALEFSSATMVYTVRIECKMSVFDAAGTLLGEVIAEHWA
jgi:hypothetical protein